MYILGMGNKSRKGLWHDYPANMRKCEKSLGAITSHIVTVIH